MTPYHVGFVVDDIEREMARHTTALGLTWARVTARPVRVVVDGAAEPREAALLATYSQQGPPYVELIQEVTGDLWGPRFRRLDHVGYWVPDLAAGFERLAGAGMDSSVQAVDARGRPTRFSYQRSLAGPGPWIELVDEAIRPSLLEWIGGGGYDVS